MKESSEGIPPRPEDGAASDSPTPAQSLDYRSSRSDPQQYPRWHPLARVGGFFGGLALSLMLGVLALYVGANPREFPRPTSSLLTLAVFGGYIFLIIWLYRRYNTSGFLAGSILGLCLAALPVGVCFMV